MREAVLNSTLTTPVCGLNISHGYGIALSALLTGLNVLLITYPECKLTIQPGLRGLGNWAGERGGGGEEAGWVDLLNHM